jgi:hypothetical protein
MRYVQVSTELEPRSTNRPRSLGVESGTSSVSRMVVLSGRVQGSQIVMSSRFGKERGDVVAAEGYKTSPTT